MQSLSMTAWKRMRPGVTVIDTCGTAPVNARRLTEAASNARPSCASGWPVAVRIARSVIADVRIFSRYLFVGAAPFRRPCRLENVADRVVALVARVFVEDVGLITSQRKRHLPRPHPRLRIFDQHFVLQRVGIAQPKAF